MNCLHHCKHRLSNWLSQQLSMQTRMLPCRGMSVFKTLRGIQQLDLTDTMVADPGMQHITRLKDLKTLSLAYSSESKCLKPQQTLSRAGHCDVLDLPTTGLPVAACPAAWRQPLHAAQHKHGSCFLPWCAGCESLTALLCLCRM